MKILVLNYEFPPVGGGGGKACADLCKALAARGHELRVLTTMVPGLAGREKVDGYNVRRIITGRRSLFRASFFSMAGYIVAGFLPGLQLLRRWKPDVIHAHFAVPTGVLAYLLSRLSGVPYILTAHLGDVPGGVPQKTDRWFRLVYPLTPPIWRRASKVVAVSSYTRDIALKHYSVPIQVIPNGVFLSEKLSQARPRGDPPRLIFAGRFQPQKNLPFLVEVLSRVVDLAWQCVLIGDGPSRPMVEATIHELGLSERIRLEGWVSEEQVLNWLGESDVLVMPSLSEGLPVIGIQALAQGLVIIANRTGGLVDLVDEGVNGKLCDVNDGECFESSLRWCLQDQSRLQRMKEASFSMASRYDINNAAGEYEDVFAEAAQA
jgi:glycosyltransferase involved in cell wall biosynthesis